MDVNDRNGSLYMYNKAIIDGQMENMRINFGTFMHFQYTSETIQFKNAHFTVNSNPITAEMKIEYLLNIKND